MKKYSILVLAVVLVAALFTGCGCRNTKPMDTSLPTVPPTSAPTTQATQPSTMDTVPANDATIEDGNGPLPTNATAGEDGNTGTEETNAARSRSGAANGSTKGTTGNDGIMGEGRARRVLPQS